MQFLEPFITENTFSRNKKEIRPGFSRLASSLASGDVSRKTIDNVVQLLVREAQSSNTMVHARTIIPDVDMPLVTGRKSENIDHPIPE